MWLETLFSCLRFAAALNLVAPQPLEAERLVSAPGQPLRSFLREVHREEWDMVRQISFENYVPFLNAVIARVDLNSDGRPEAIVYNLNPLCGTAGCGIDVYTQDADAWRRIGHSNTGWPPFKVLHRRSEGWHDLGMVVAGGGELRGFEVAMRFDRRSYRERPRPPFARRYDVRYPGEVVISRRNRGRPLFDT